MRPDASTISFVHQFTSALIRLLIYEDNEMLRSSLELMFTAVAGIELCHSFGNCEAAAKQIAFHKPDVVLMDIDMPGMNGIACVRIIKETRPETSVLMHTVFEDSQKIFDSLAAGADGYLLKSTSPEALIDAVKDVTSGGSPMSPGVARKVLDYFRDAGMRHEEHVELSSKEMEVLQLLTKGYTYKRIAFECGKSVDTTRTHIRNIYAKLHVNCGTEAVAKALRLRLFSE